MSEQHAFASLSPSLLARKGAAKPAMRRQDATKFVNGAGAMAQADDLGWNDWGHTHEQVRNDKPRLDPVPCEQPQPEQSATDLNGGEVRPAEPKVRSTVTEIKPVKAAAAKIDPVQAEHAEQDLADGEIPEVLRQIEQIAWRINRTMPPAGTSRSEGRRAAFTLRLDAERHFRLKMASVVLNRSSQVLVTEALDKYLSEIPEVAHAQGLNGKLR
ncbi:hypothetical protein [Novosphingobium malaysiense]|uniref:hypothetical protein n=1 Tax=Novosphingobium malaysiense TaxID=1348853 RepID=UPI00068E35B1|nr:hypothetical protein [Novosphingobium malaysiense]